MNSNGPRARLVLDDGSEFEGRAFGRPRSASGEVVFTTGMAGYPQSLTDPSYNGQILVATYPLIGNYGMPDESVDRHGLKLHYESDRAWVSGLVVSEACSRPSHHASVATLSAWLDGQGVPGIEGIDTRELTERLRSQGVMGGRILVEGEPEESAGPGPGQDAVHGTRAAPGPIADNAHSAGPVVYGRGGFPRIALVDCGVKNNILRCLLERGAEIARLPWNGDLSGLEYDGILLSNGPGDPKAYARTIGTARRTLGADKPVFGVCLGAQIMALAAGADTYKLPYGHRGQNQPCVERGTGRCYNTSQNHGYAVREESLPGGWESWFVNGNDGTVEGIRSTAGPFQAVQFHPEGCPGPRDTEFLFDRFLDEVRRFAAGRSAA
jgi:carbamoyl-phosphate synthase small subunit